jgi:hypothetical protein
LVCAISISSLHLDQPKGGRNTAYVFCYQSF